MRRQTAAEYRKYQKAYRLRKLAKEPDYYNNAVRASNARRRIPEEKHSWPASFPHALLCKFFKAQNGRCAICLVDLRQHGKKASSACADRDPETGTPRGILCRGCSWGLEHFGGKAEHLENAAWYVRSK